MQDHQDKVCVCVLLRLRSKVTPAPYSSSSSSISALLSKYAFFWFQKPTVLIPFVIFPLQVSSTTFSACLRVTSRPLPRPPPIWAGPKSSAPSARPNPGNLRIITASVRLAQCVQTCLIKMKVVFFPAQSNESGSLEDNVTVFTLFYSLIWILFLFCFSLPIRAPLAFCSPSIISA